ncbi:hypothetical protein SteCoe_6907 [Stentor coeruleus]|uniref:C2H2-type domain-containing protein n=1 Tax=Stentor coeruleus TaxID=5963 RepID=A0A1R2CNP7_9CILI|nr:hypothetical protein SteCoe_6907 [Stentor coeruleus]
MERPRTTLARIDQDESFLFKQRSGGLNWKEIQSLDLDEMIQRGDINKLSELLENITYSNIDKTDLEKYPDTFIIKLLKLSQFALEFLQEEKLKLETVNKEISQEKNIVQKSSKDLEEKIEIHTKKIKTLSRQMQHKHKTLATYEYLLKDPATMNYMNRAINKDKAVKCQECSKAFLNHDYYLKHYERRHAVQSRPQTAPLLDVQNMKSTLEEQLKNLKEQQENEINEFKSIIQQQLIEIKNAKTQVFETAPIQNQEFLRLSSMIEIHRKELLEIRFKQRQQEDIMRRKEDEIRKLEMENQKLIRNKEKLDNKIKTTKYMESRRKSPIKEDTKLSIDANSYKKSKLRTESGETNVVNVWNELIKDSNKQEIEVDHSKDDEMEKRELFTPYSERMSPTFKDYEGPWEYVLPLESPEPHHIIQAAKVLGIDPVKETQYLYLATEFLKTPIPKAWIASKVGESTVFKHKETGEIRDTHPGIEFFKALYKNKRNKKHITFDKVKAIIKLPGMKFLTEKYTEGIFVFFKPDNSVFSTHKLMLKEKIQTALDKMKNISTQQLNKINEEREKIFNERGGEYRRANEIINSELLTIYNKLKA